MKNKFNYKNKNCIVTGGSGFIGQVLVKKLITNGSNVYVVDKFLYGAKKSDIDKDAIVIKGDIRERKILNKLPNIKFQYFFHFAAPSSVVLFNKNPLECTDITVQGFLNTINFCKKRGIKFIYPSTGSIYSGVKSPQSETSPIQVNALNSYAKCKLALELIQKSINDVDSLGLRIFAGYGPQEKHKGGFASVIYLFCKDMIEGKSPIIFGDGNQKRDFVYIDDVVEAILILAKESKDKIVNVGSGKSTSFKEVIRLVNKILNINIKPIYIKKPNSYLETTKADIRLMNKYCSRPKYSIEEGIRQIISSL